MNPEGDPITLEEEKTSRKEKEVGWLVTPGAVVCTVRCVIRFAFDGFSTECACVLNYMCELGM